MNPNIRGNLYMTSAAHFNNKCFVCVGIDDNHQIHIELSPLKINYHLIPSVFFRQVVQA